MGKGDELFIRAKEIETTLGVSSSYAYKVIEEYIIKAYLMNKKTPAQLSQKNDIDKFMIINPKRDCLEKYSKYP